MLPAAALFCLLVAGARASDADADADAFPVGGGVTLRLEHSFDNGATFERRGALSIHSLRSGSASIEPQALAASDADKDAVRRLCDADDLYMVRLSAPEAPTTYYRTATHACNLVRSGLTEVYTVQLDWRYKVVNVHLSTPSEQPHLQKEVTLVALKNFRSKVYVQYMESGPAPDTASFIQKMEQEKLAKQRGETKDNRSFLAKYWMYIIPAVLFLAMSSSGAQDGGR